MAKKTSRTTLPIRVIKPRASVRPQDQEQSDQLNNTRNATNASKGVTLKHTGWHDPVTEGFKGFYTKLIHASTYHDSLNDRIQLNSTSDNDLLAILKQDPLSAYATLLNNGVKVLGIATSNGLPYGPFYRLLGGETEESQGIILRAMPKALGISGTASSLVRSGNLNTYRDPEPKLKSIERTLAELVEKNPLEIKNPAHYQIRHDVDQIAGVLEKYLARQRLERPF